MHREPRPGGVAAARKIVLHVNVGPEVEGGAASLSRYLDTIQAGYHEIVDDREVVLKAGPAELVWGASGMNDHGYHVCLIGSVQTPQQWADAYSNAEVHRAAARVAQLCHGLNIAPVHLSDAQVADVNAKGICDHWAVNRAIVIPANQRGDHSMGPGDHTDVGAGFPWSTFMSLVQSYYAPAPAPPKVAPMFNPAIQVVGGIAAWAVFPDGKNLIVVGRYGHVYASDGMHRGAPAEHPEYWFVNGKSREVAEVHTQGTRPAGVPDAGKPWVPAGINPTTKKPYAYTVLSTSRETYSY